MSATLASVLAEVYNLTKRPDLASVSTTAVKAATLKAHQKDFFVRDLKEDAVQFLIADFYQQLDYKTLFPYWRAISYARLYDPTAIPQPDETSQDFKLITPSDSFDSYNVMKDRVMYLAGSNFNFKNINAQFQYILVGHYDNPNVTDAGYTSWIADDYPYAIIFEAARYVFKTIAFDEQAAVYEKLCAEQMQIVMQNNVTAQGS